MAPVNDDAATAPDPDLPDTADASFELLLGAVGPRLKTIRQGRGETLAQVSASTGISVSTLSRLEAGQRRPTLELLLPLARTYRMPLDELIDEPPIEDPRVQSRPVTRNGMTFIALTRRPGGLEAYKIIIPPNRSVERPEQQVHLGYTWFYVLAGRLRLLLGEHDLTLTAGEVAEFDTRTPHAMSNPGPDPAEVLALSGPQGERMHVRIKPRGATDR